MAVQVRVTWKLVGNDDLEITSAFGHLDESGETENETSPAPIDRVLTPESSTVASGLAVAVG